MVIRKPEMFKQAECGRGKNLIIQILIFFAVFVVNSMLQSILPSIYMGVEIVKTFASYPPGVFNEVVVEALIEAAMGSVNGRIYMLLTLFSTVFGILVPIFFCKLIEKRPLSSMGFVKKNAFRDYFIGLGIGFLMFGAVVLINVLTGAISIEGVNKNLSVISVVYILIFFVGFMIQGASEEVLVRGYFMTSLGSKHNLWIALLISSGMFGLLHIGNPGFTILGFVNIILVGILFGLYIICFDNIWGACALHTMWNFVQGNFYGIPVSGLEISDSVFITTINEDLEFINGGTFGAEGGFTTTIVMLLCIGGLLLYMKKTGKFVEKEN